MVPRLYNSHAILNLMEPKMYVKAQILILEQFSLNNGIHQQFKMLESKNTLT